jgi:uncharacterized membrane protein
LNKKTVSREQKDILLSQRYEGPLPLPDLLRAYDKVLNGAAREIIDMAKEHQAHVIWMDQAGIRQARLELIFYFVLGFMGQIGSILITLSGFYMSYVYIKTGEPALGYSVAGISAIICSYLIWWKTRSQAKEKEN